jgi:hypothetical protein
MYKRSVASIINCAQIDNAFGLQARKSQWGVTYTNRGGN